MASYPGYPQDEQKTAAQRAIDQNHEEKRGVGDPNLPVQGGQPVKPVPVMSPHDSYEMAKKQSKERSDMLQKQAKARADAAKAAKANPQAVAPDLMAAQAKETADMATRHKAEREKAGAPATVYNGLALQEAVGALHAELTALAPEHDFEVSELRAFGLEFDVFDPVTGTLTSPARAHRRDVGDAGQLLSADSVVADIESSRRHQATAGVTTYAVDRVA